MRCGKISMALAAGMAMLDCWLHHFQQLVKKKESERKVSQNNRTSLKAWTELVEELVLLFLSSSMIDSHWLDLEHQTDRSKLGIWRDFCDSWMQNRLLLVCEGREGNGTPLPVLLPGKSQGQGSWWTAFSGVAQSQTWLKRLSSSSSSSLWGVMHLL